MTPRRHHLIWAALAICLLALVPTLSFAQADETYLRFTISSREELAKLTRLLSIDNVVGDTVYAYANPRQLAELEAAGYRAQPLPHPSSLVVPRMAESKEAFAWDTYPTYTTYVSMMQSYAQAHPSLCRLDTIGTTIQGRLLLMATISDNVNVEEDEPEVLYTSSIHGDEVTGFMLTLRLMDSLLTTYASDPQIAALVNGTKIYINPLANPDGTYYGGNNNISGARRSNANGIDLNRNYPDPQDGQHPDGNAWQVETIAFMNWADSHHPLMGFNFHGGAEVFNYPWDTWVTRHADDAWFQYVGRKYVDTVHAHAVSGYLTDENNGITHGYDWYEVNGGRQDFMNYWHGCREVTLEISGTKLPAASEQPTYWEYNYRSLIQYLWQSHYGIRGIVTSSYTGLPLAATIRVLSHDVDNSQVTTDPTVGDYHRLIKAGTYTLEFSATNYISDTVSGVVVADNAATILDVQLDPLSITPSLTLQSQSAYGFDAGDTVAFSATLVNSGGGPATGLVGTVGCSDGLVSLLTDTASFPTIAAYGGVGTCNPSFRFVVSSGATRGHEIPFSMILAADGGYLDTVTFSAIIGQRIEDFESGTFSAYPWTQGGSRPWVINSASTHQGTYAAKSGTLTNSQSSQLLLTLDSLEAGTITFWMRVSSEAGFDFLRFSIDGVDRNAWSGDVAWQQVSFPVTAGTHSFRWVYVKNGSGSAGSDAAWIDYVVFPYHQVAQPTCCAVKTGNVDGDGSDMVDISDLSRMVDYLFFGGTLSSCAAENDVDRSGSVDISDLQSLVDFLFFSGTLPSCP